MTRAPRPGTATHPATHPATNPHITADIAADITAAAPPAAAAAVLVDTGILLALFDRQDPHHAAATAWLARCDATLHTIEAVLTEAAYFLPARLRPALARMVAQGVLRLHPLSPAGHGRLAQLFDKYCDIDPDWADLGLVCLAETSGLHRIATLDSSDFKVYRIHGRKRFALELLG